MIYLKEMTKSSKQSYMCTRVAIRPWKGMKSILRKVEIKA